MIYRNIKISSNNKRNPDEEDLRMSEKWLDGMKGGQFYSTTLTCNF